MLETLEAAGRVERFDEFVERCLYDPSDGFYSTHGNAGGSHGDFLTSPEVGPLFGVVVARALDGCWRDLGCPAPFTLLEAGAGRGVLVKSILAAAPECREALRVITVERSARLRALQAELLGDGRCGSVNVPIEIRADMPVPESDGGFDGVIITNELLDNLAFRIVERVDGEWMEIRVDAGADELVATPAGPADRMDPAIRAVLPTDDGARVPVCEHARDWVTEATAQIRRGRLINIDYGVRSTTHLVGRDWLRTYRNHVRSSDALEAPGRTDITCDVPFDQLPAGATISTQAEFLQRWGIDELVAEGQQVWTERAHLGDLAAIKGRSRVTEAAALCDPLGLGGFIVAEWSFSP